MTGAILNAAAIIVGGIAGVAATRPVPARTQLTLKILLGALTIFVGLRITFLSLGGTLGSAVRLLIIAVLALTFGRLTGRALHLQRGLNRLGQYARQRISFAGPNTPNRVGEGFITCALLYCMAPLAVLGSIQDGLAGYWETLGIKSVMDGLATMALVATFGWGVILSALPVLAYEGTITLAAQLLSPVLQQNQALLPSVHVTSGLLVFSVALIILELKKIELADYLPSLVYAPLLAWVWS